MKTVEAVIAIIAVITFLVGFVILVHTIGYKSGQIDALTGKIEFQLVTHPDSTKTWERIDANSPNK